MPFLTHLRGFVVLGAGLAALAAPTIAQEHLPVCDPEFNVSLTRKAWAETQREVQMNNTIIKKPASVLALSCFDQHIKQASEAGALFADNDDLELDDGITSTAGSAFENFLLDNFPEGEQPSFDSGGTYKSGCDRLNKMWTSAKCVTTEALYFSNVREMQAQTEGGQDIRTDENGSECKATADLANIYKASVSASSNLPDRRDEANKEGQKGDKDYDYFAIARPDFCSVKGKKGTNALADAEICSNEEGGAEKCSAQAAIPTGQVVRYTAPPSGLSADDQVWAFRCLNPGCYFDPAANASAIKYTAGGTPPTNLKCTYKPY